MAWDNGFFPRAREAAGFHTPVRVLAGLVLGGVQVTFWSCSDSEMKKNKTFGAVRVAVKGTQTVMTNATHQYSVYNCR